eukprot:scaffold4682_cov18-Tisochrysis_lutea.AAC.2
MVILLPPCHQPQVETGGNNSLHVLAAIPNPKNGRDLVKMVIASGVDPNKPNQAGDYPLHIAARVGSNEVTTSSLTINVKLSAIRPHFGLSVGRDIVCQALLDGGADALRRNGKNRRPREVPPHPLCCGAGMWPRQRCNRLLCYGAACGQGKGAIGCSAVRQAFSS